MENAAGVACLDPGSTPGGSTGTGVRLPWLHTMIIVVFAEGEHSVDRAVDAVGIWIV